MDSLLVRGDTLALVAAVGLVALSAHGIRSRRSPTWWLPPPSHVPKDMNVTEHLRNQHQGAGAVLIRYDPTSPALRTAIPRVPQSYFTLL